MVFFIGILFGVLFVWIALRSGLYSTFALMFNMVIAVYLAIFLRPMILKIIPMDNMPLYANSVGMFLTAAACFAILYGITFVFFTGPYNIVFPKIFDILFAGILGFIAGFFVWSFISLLITISPISQKPFLTAFSYSSQQESYSSLRFFCGLIHNFTAKKSADYSIENAIDDLLKNAEKQMKKPEPVAPVTPPAQSATTVRSSDPNKPDTAVTDSNTKPLPAPVVSDPNKNK